MREHERKRKAKAGTRGGGKSGDVLTLVARRHMQGMDGMEMGNGGEAAVLRISRGWFCGG